MSLLYHQHSSFAGRLSDVEGGGRASPTTLVQHSQTTRRGARPFRPICVAVARQSRDFVTLITKFCASNERLASKLSTKFAPSTFARPRPLPALMRDPPSTPCPPTHTPKFFARATCRAAHPLARARAKKYIQKSVLRTLAQTSPRTCARAQSAVTRWFINRREPLAGSLLSKINGKVTPVVVVQYIHIHIRTHIPTCTHTHTHTPTRRTIGVNARGVAGSGWEDGTEQASGIVSLPGKVEGGRREERWKFQSHKTRHTA